MHADPFFARRGIAARGRCRSGERRVEGGGEIDIDSLADVHARGQTPVDFDQIRVSRALVDDALGREQAANCESADKALGDIAKVGRMKPADDGGGALDVAMRDEPIDGKSRKPLSLPSSDVLVADVTANVLLNKPPAGPRTVERP